jgi:hypothetical protein
MFVYGRGEKRMTMGGKKVMTRGRRSKIKERAKNFLQQPSRGLNIKVHWHTIVGGVCEHLHHTPHLSLHPDLNRSVDMDRGFITYFRVI